MEGHMGFESPPCVEEFLLEGVQQLTVQYGKPIWEEDCA